MPHDDASTFILGFFGILLGMILGVLIGLGLAWFISQVIFPWAFTR